MPALQQRPNGVNLKLVESSLVDNLLEQGA